MARPEVRISVIIMEFYRLRFPIDTGSEHLKRELELSVAAGENERKNLF